MASPSVLEEVTESIERMQHFDPTSLEQREEFGILNFAEAVAPARRLVDLYKRLSTSMLADFPDDLLGTIKNQANADYTRFDQILTFDVKQQNPAPTRDAYVSGMGGAYDVSFRVLWPYIAYGVSKITDTQRLETEARGVMQSVRDQAKKVTKELEGYSKQADGVLAEIRNVAAEQGVSQQAIHFHNEAESHMASARVWYKRTQWAGGGIFLFACLVLVGAYIPEFRAQDSLQAVQILSGKVLVFAVLAYWLSLCARNYLSHKHNQVVNQHRENALKTFKALAEGAGNPDNKDVVLTHASMCIFSPQDTGYIKSGGNGESSSSIRSVIEVLPKALGKDS